MGAGEEINSHLDFSGLSLPIVNQLRRPFVSLKKDFQMHTIMHRFSCLAFFNIQKKIRFSKS